MIRTGPQPTRDDHVIAMAKAANGNSNYTVRILRPATGVGGDGWYPLGMIFSTI